MTKNKKKELKKRGDYPYSLRFNTRFNKYDLIVTDNETIRISSEDHRGYAGGVTWEKNGFQNSKLIVQLEEMIKDEIDSKEAENKIKYYYSKELKKIKPLFGGNWELGTLSDDYSTFKIDFNRDLSQKPLISKSKVIWFLSKDFEETNYFHDLSSFDRYAINNVLHTFVSKIFFENKYIIIGISNQIEKIDNYDIVYYDKTFEKKEILEKILKNNLNVNIVEDFKYSYFCPKIKDIGISFTWKKEK